MDFYEAFAHTWGSTGTVDEGLTTTQYDQGWNFIGSRPPRLGEFNKREKLIDQRLKWLYDQLKTAADAHGVTLAGADVGGLLAILQKPTAPTPPQFDSDSSIATTAFVQRAAGSLNSFVSYTGDKVLAASDVGRPIQIYGTGAMTVTLPLASACPSGSVITLVVSDAGAIVNIAKQGSDLFTFGNPDPLRYGDSIQFVSNGIGSWWSFNGTNHNQKSSGMFGSSLAAIGYQKLPSGLIIQWGIAPALGASETRTVTLPITFPAGAKSVTLTGDGATPTVRMAALGATTFQLQNLGTASQNAYWVAFGY